MARVINIFAASVCMFAAVICFISGNIGLGFLDFAFALMNIYFAVINS